jgi:hypothetical protein
LFPNPIFEAANATDAQAWLPQGSPVDVQSPLAGLGLAAAAVSPQLEVVINAQQRELAAASHPLQAVTAGRPPAISVVEMAQLSIPGAASGSISLQRTGAMPGYRAGSDDRPINHRAQLDKAEALKHTAKT